MNIEDLKVITGSETEVQKAAAKYLASHEKAKIISSSVTVSYPPAPATDEKAKAAPIKPITAVCLVLGKVF